MAELRCGSCGTAAPGPTDWRCGACGSPLELELPPADPATFVDDGAGGLWRYRGWLPQVDPVVLGEPPTALVDLGDPRHGQARGRPADGLVQGPWHGGDRVVAAGARRARDRGRLVGQRGCVVRRVRGSCRRPVAAVRARRRLARQAAPGACPRRHRGGGAGATVRGRRGGPPVARGCGTGRRVRLAPLAAGVPRRDRDLRLRGLRGARRPRPGRGRRAARWRHVAARRPPRVRASPGGRADRSDARVSSASRATPARRWPGRSVPANPTRSRSRRDRRSPRASASTARRARSRSWPRSARPVATSSR